MVPLTQRPAYRGKTSRQRACGLCPLFWFSIAYIINCSETQWIKATLLFCSWVKELGKSQLISDDGSLSHGKCFGALCPVCVRMCCHPPGCPHCGLIFFSYSMVVPGQSHFLHGTWLPIVSVSRDRKQKLPVCQGLGSETGTVSFPLYSVDQRSHRAYPDSKGKEVDLTSQWDHYQRI